MTDAERDHFDSVRRELLAATRRSVRRGRRRRQRAMLAVAALASLIVLTGIATAASDDVARFVGSLTGGTVGDVFEGEPQITKPPSEATQEMLHDMEALRRGLNPEESNDAAGLAIEPRVLLRDEFDGTDVEIVAYERPAGSPSGRGPAKRAETCYSVRTEPPRAAGGGVTCSPEFNPGLPINHSSGIAYGCEIGAQYGIAGIAASSVRAVRIVTEEGVEDALMGDGAFYWHSTGTAMPTRISVELIDGSVVSRPVPPGPSQEVRARLRDGCPDD